MRDVSISIYVDPTDVLDDLFDDEILEYLKEERGIDVDEYIKKPNDSRRLPPQNIRERLCEMFDLAALTPVDEILKTIESKIR